MPKDFNSSLFESEEALEEDHFSQKNSQNLRDGILFLVDCSKCMFEIIDEEGLNLFEKSMRVIQSMYQNKIYSNNKDFLGILFFGTEYNNTGEVFKHMYMLQELDQPNADHIKKIENLTQINTKKFIEYGHSDKFNLDKVFWYCSNMFSMVQQKIDSKRVMIFTHNPNPHDKNKKLEKLAKNKAKDLYDIGINIELVPLIRENESFDYSLFYGDILMLSEDQIKSLPDPAQTYEKLEKIIRCSYQKHKPISHLSFCLCKDLAISCNLYNLIHSCSKPTKIKLDKKTNEETKSNSRRYIPETGEVLFLSDTKIAIDMFDNRLTFEEDEIKAIKIFESTGMKLIGFKPLSSLKPYMHMRPVSFVYPDEKTIEGSTLLFKSLLSKCLEKSKFMLCQIIVRMNSSPRLAALYPQEEKLDENRLQISPAGFHLIFLPYNDDFRDVEQKIPIKPSRKNIDLFKRCVSKLKFQYCPDDFRNPAIEKIWSEIETIALDRIEPEIQYDITIPNNERIEKRAGNFLAEFSHVFEVNIQEQRSSTKRKAKTNQNQAIKKIKE